MTETPMTRKEQRLRYAEKLFVIGALLLFSRAYSPLYGRLGTFGDLLQPGLYAVVFGLILLLIIRHLGRVLFVLQLDRLLLVIVGYVVVSVLWSVDRMASLASLPVFLGATMLGVYLAARFSLEEQITLLFWVLVVSMISSLVVGLLLPEWGIMQDTSNAGSWQGVYGHKNDLGRFAVLAIVVFSLEATRRRWGILLILVPGALLLLSRSATSAAALVLFALTIPLVRLVQWRRSSLLPLILAATVFLGAVLAVLVLANSTAIIGAIGKDLTLTGRTDLWVDVWYLIQQKPWGGYGYNAFWLGLDGPSAFIWVRHGWRPNHAHNGFLDLWLELGVIGLLLVVLHLVLNVIAAWRFAMKSRSPASLWPIALILLLLLFNFNYSVLVSQSVFFWALYLGAVLSVRIQLRRRVPDAPAEGADPTPFQLTETPA